MSGSKLVVIVSWIAAIALWSFAGGWLGLLGQITFWLLIVSHAAECLVKRKLFERVGGSMLQHFALTMVFGLFHWRPLEKQLEAEAP